MRARRAVEEERLEAVRAGLQRAFGPPARAPRRDPVTQLVRAILGARTPDAVTEAVMVRLKGRFWPWMRLLEARPEEVLALIGPVASPQDKAERLIATLRQVRVGLGELRLDPLQAWPLEEALAWLEALPGVGAEIAADVLNLSTLGRRVMGVDAHVARVADRLGLTPGASTPAALRDALTACAPPAWDAQDLRDLRILLSRLSQLFCHPQAPQCPACPLAASCPGRLDRRIGRPEPRNLFEVANENIKRTDATAFSAYLRRRIARIEQRDAQGSVAQGGVRWGEPTLDAAFAHEGLPPGVHQSAAAALHDLAAPLLLPVATAARAPARSGVRLLVVQERDAAVEGGELYGPGMLAFGLDPGAVAFARVRDGPEALRVADEALKRNAAPTLLLELRRGEGLVDLALTRRFNLAARRNGAFVFLATPQLEATSAAITRWRVASAPSREARRRLGAPAFTLNLLKNRAGRTGDWTAEWSAHERRFRNVAPLAAPVDAPVDHRPRAPHAARPRA